MMKETILVNLKKALDLLANHMVLVRSNLAIVQGIQEQVDEDADYIIVMNQAQHRQTAEPLEDAAR